MSFFPIIELVDRFVIAQLKFNKGCGNQEELDFYSNQLKPYDLQTIQDKLDQMYDIHNNIWLLESELKTGREAELDLAEIGRRAIAIRNWNNKRIAIKNSIAETLGCVVRETKRDHLSE